MLAERLGRVCRDDSLAGRRYYRNDLAALADADAAQALTKAVKPAYEALMAEMTAQEKVAGTDDGVWRFPDGAGYYAERLANYTTTNMTPDQIHNLGLAQVARIHKEMGVVQKKMGVKGDLQAFFKYMRTEPKFYAPETEEGRALYLSETQKAQDAAAAANPDGPPPAVQRRWYDGLGVLWMLAIPFGPAFSWIITNWIGVDRGNWENLLGFTTLLCVVIPVVGVLPLLRYLKRETALVGGASGSLISNMIDFHMDKANWSMAAALSAMLLAGVLVLYWLYDRLVGIDNLKLG